MKYILLSLFLFCRLSLKAQASYNPRLKMMVYTYVEHPPAFPGGEEALAKFLSKNLHFSEGILDEGQFTVFLSCVIDSSGNMVDKHVANKDSTAGYTLLEKEGLRVLNAMPKWTPGMQNGKKVAVLFTLPIRFCPQE
jgi:periplasmic protein TonB